MAPLRCESGRDSAALTPALRVLTSDELKSTIVGLFEPKPGTYTIDLLPDSPDITKVTESEDPGRRASPRASAAAGRNARHLRREAPSRPSLLGIGAETKTVARFRPPSQRLGRPSRVTVRQRSGTPRVAFKRVAEARS